LKIDLLARILNRITLPASRIGMPRTKNAVAIFPPLMIAITAMMNPKNMLPLVPINILAGGKTNGRNTNNKIKTIPARIAENGWFTFGKRDKIKRVPQLMIPIEVVSPSIPSTQLITFIIATTQITVAKPEDVPKKNNPPKGLVICVMDMPNATIKMAIKI